MARHLVVSGLVGGLLAASSWTAMAQEARPASGDCSGFMCKVFGSKIYERPTQPAATAVDGAASGEKARLFTEQLHIVAGTGVLSPADLKGKVVSFGPEKGPAQAAARKAFAALGVSVKETPLDLDNALDGIATGDVAAVVVLAPQPDARLARLKTTSGLHLVSWPEGTAVPDGDTMTSIPGSAYPGLAKAGDSVRALGVEAALDASGKGATSPAARAFLTALSQHSAALSKRGFDLIKADLETRNGRRVASAERR